MKKLIFPLLLLILLGGAQMVGATSVNRPARSGPSQQGSPAPPAIISFTSDLAAITVGEAEAGTQTTTLSWRTAGMSDDYDLVLHFYEVSGWKFLLDDEEKLEANGTFKATVTHPLNFRPPTFRLAVTDKERTYILSEQTVTIAYEVEAGTTPHIDSFSTDRDSVSANALAYENLQLPVRWQVSNRTPTSNLVFEQILADGKVQSVEMPRQTLWVGSSGEGMIVPEYPGSGQALQIRLRLVDLITDTTLDEATINIGVTGSVSTPTPGPTPRPAVSNPGSGSGSSGSVPPPVVGAGAGGGFELGGHVIYYNNANEMRSAGMTWSKVQLRWNLGEGTDAAAGLINAAHANGFKALLSIVGYPSQMGDFNPYTDAYAAYLGQVAALGPNAIEVWNEPNLAREWPAGTVNGASYTQMLGKAYNAIKAANPGVMVISAALAPTGFFGGCAAGGCDDNVFLQQMASAGAINYMDCIGAHYNEGIISPDLRSGDPRGGHYSRYFWGTLDLYYNTFGGARRVCWTELGYLSGEGYPPLPPNFAWAQGTTLAQHAEWLGRATVLSRSSGKVRLMIVWNVDFKIFTDDPQAGYAIIRPDGTCPACGALAAAMQ